MKYFRLSLALLLLCGSLNVAKADEIPDFQFNVQDPPPMLNPPPVIIYTPNTPISLDFQGCAFGETIATGPSSSVGATGCAYASNYTGMTITGLTVDIADTPAFMNQGVTCYSLSSDGGSGSAFAGANCNLVGSTYVLQFAGGPGVPNERGFTLEYYVPPGSALGNDDFVTTADAVTTPEPSSILLMSSGTLFVGFMMYRRRESLFSSLN